MASENSITVFRGEHVTLNFTHTPDPDIQTWQIKFTVAKKPNSTTKLIGPMNVFIVDATHYRVVLAEEDTDLSPGTYFFDTWRFDEGFEEVLAYGQFTIAGDARVPPIE